jgi:ankyrin repeat protein
LKYKPSLEDKDFNNQNCLFYLMKNKHKHETPTMLNMILDITPHLVNSQASNKKSILFSAVEMGKTELVKILLERGANPNDCIADTKDTPLHMAVKSLKKPIV